MSSTQTKKISRRSFLKILTGFFVVFATGGINTLFSKNLEKDKSKSTSGYGQTPYGI